MRLRRWSWSPICNNCEPLVRMVMEEKRSQSEAVYTSVLGTFELIIQELLMNVKISLCWNNYLPRPPVG